MQGDARGCRGMLEVEARAHVRRHDAVVREAPAEGLVVIEAVGVRLLLVRAEVHRARIAQCRLQLGRVAREAPLRWCRPPGPVGLELAELDVLAGLLLLVLVTLRSQSVPMRALLLRL